MIPNMEPKPEICELCEVNKPDAYYFKMWLCNNCKSEQEAVIQDIKQARDESIVNSTIDYIEKNKDYDSTLKMREDIFNSESLTIQELVNLVNSDDRITNKNFRVCELVQEKITGLKKLIFDEHERLLELNNRLGTNQRFLTDYANKLRSEEREKLKLQDNTYKPVKVAISKPKLVSIKKKVDKELVRKCVAEINTEFPNMGITEVLFQMIMIQKGRGAEDTLFDLRRKFKESTS